MELKENLEVFIKKAWALHDGLTGEINNSFSTFCSKNGRFCNIADTSFQAKQRFIAIRDSLKDVGDVLMLLQLIERHAALARLEESRDILIERVKEYKGKSLEIVKELNSCFNTAFDWNMNGIKTKVEDSNVEKKRRKWGIRMLLDPWKWQNAFVVAAKLVLVSISISSAVKLCDANRQQYSIVEPRKDTLSNSSLDVFNGRG